MRIEQKTILSEDNMLSYIEHYGEDADGNRGEYRVMYELQHPKDEGYYK